MQILKWDGPTAFRILTSPLNSCDYTHNLADHLVMDTYLLKVVHAHLASDLNAPENEGCDLQPGTVFAYLRDEAAKNQYRDRPLQQIRAHPVRYEKIFIGQATSSQLPPKEVLLKKAKELGIDPSRVVGLDV